MDPGFYNFCLLRLVEASGKVSLQGAFSYRNYASPCIIFDSVVRPLIRLKGEHILNEVADRSESH
jgi:hypothetical protein